MFNLFKRKANDTKSQVSDFSTIAVDMHSHLLAGIDDGAKTLDDSIDLIRGLQSLGYKKLITTPHVMADFYKNTPETINKALQLLKDRLDQEGLDLQVEAAAEYYLDEAFVNQINEDSLLSFGDRVVLFELSFMQPSPLLTDVIFKLRSKGYKPVLAHPERYPYWAGNWKQWEELAGRGLMLQVNINSFEGYYGQGPQQMAEGFAKRDMVSFVGSDAHHMRHLDSTRRALQNPVLNELLSKGKLLNSSLL